MKRAKRKQITVYYNEHGKVDKFATYINNHDWCLPVFITVVVILTGLVEGM